MRNITAAILLSIVLATAAARAGDEVMQQPINYGKVAVDDPIARIQKQIDAGKLKLAHDDAHGYLAAVLNALGIKPSSQTLVFSKTSFQRRAISPKTPRALYFNDDVYIGFIPGAPKMEVSAVDPKLGGIFYTLEQSQDEKPTFSRTTD